MSRTSPYTLLPKSVKGLLTGQYWSIPLRDGSFACGRVIQLPCGEAASSKTLFIAGLLDWHSGNEPTSECIANRPCIAQGIAHIKTIKESGGLILGHRPLEFDDIEPWEVRGAMQHKGSHVFKGFEIVRAQTPADDMLPMQVVFGLLAIKSKAEHKFL